ncbi:MAG: DUF2335 domain-containing protein [Flavobacteriales bacterium]
MVEDSNPVQTETISAGAVPEAVKQKNSGLPQSDDDRELSQAFISTTVHEAFRGPMPPPILFTEYNEVIKDGAERVFEMAQKQVLHRMQLENYAIKEELKQSRNGQLFGFVLSLTGLSLATLFAMSDREMLAGIFGTTTVIGLVTVFVIGKRMRQKD